MSNGGRHGHLLVAMILVGAFGIGTAGCSSGGPSAAAKGLCGSVFATSPPSNVSVAVDTRTIKAGEESGNPALDHAASNWLKALHQRNDAAISDAEHQIVSTCNQLGIPLGTFTPPG